MGDPILQETGHSAIEELKFALWFGCCFSHAVEQGTGISSQATTRFHSERDQVGMAVLSALGHGSPSGCVSVSARASSDKLSRPSLWANHRNVYQSALAPLVEDNVQPSLSNLAIDHHSQLRQNLFQSRPGVNVPLGEVGNTSDKTVMPCEQPALI